MVFYFFVIYNKLHINLKWFDELIVFLIPYISWQMITVVKQLIQGDELNFQNIISNIFSLEPGHLMEHCGMFM